MVTFIEEKYLNCNETQSTFVLLFISVIRVYTVLSSTYNIYARKNIVTIMINFKLNNSTTNAVLEMHN